MLDLKIINGSIIDGTGSKAYQGDIGIKDGKITAIGNLEKEEADKVIDAAGLAVAPGFIDLHTHSDMSIIYDRYARSRIYAGVTTDVIGNCGIGVAPVAEDKKQLLIDYLGTRIVGTIPAPLELHWSTFKEYLDYVDEHNPAINVVPLLAQGAIRIKEMGFSKEPATPEQIERMKQDVIQGFEEGARALTSGLIYMPGAYTPKEELAALSSVIGEYGGYYCTHMRSESDDIFEAIDEAIYIAREAKCPLHISHLKLMGKDNWHQIDKLFGKINAAREEGIEVTFDAYPYTAGMTSLSALLPPWVLEGGIEKLMERIQDEKCKEQIKKDIATGIPGWQNYYAAIGNWKGVIIASVMTEANKWMEGKTLEEVAQAKGMDPYETIYEILMQEKARVQVVTIIMDEEDVAKIIGHPDCMYGSDSMSLSTEGLLSIGKPHARAFGTQGRIFDTYVRKMGLMTTEEAVKKMTSMPAQRLGLTDRGTLKEGYAADIVVFDPETIADNATYANPQQYNTGIFHVVVNGKIALEDGKQTEELAGRVLRGPIKKK